MSQADDKNMDPIQEMRRLAENFLNIADWGFSESFQSKTSGDLIYDSEWCRVNLVWSGWDYGVGNIISIYYGRLHAPNQKARMIWNGEECHCWHDFQQALHFLDGQTPDEAVKQLYSYPSIDQFYNEKFRQRFRYRQPEWLAQVHITIWKSYGKQFFELFDLRRPDLWEQYQRFLKEFYDIKGRVPEIKPPLDKVC